MGCTSKIVKYFMFIFNFVFVLAGLALLVLGIISKLKLESIIPLASETNVSVGPNILITVGAITFFIAFLGCCGALRDSKCMLTVYAVILLVAFILQISAGIYSFVAVKDSSDEFKTEIYKALQVNFNDYKASEEAKIYIDNIQQNLGCCGMTGSSEWTESLPSSCCSKGMATCTVDNCFQKGCAEIVYKEVKEAMKVLGYVALGLCVTELIATIFALCLVSSIRNEERRGTYT